MKIFLSLLIASILSFGSVSVYPLEKDYFSVIDNDGFEKMVDMRGKDFIVISLREVGSDGRFYAVDRDGVVWMHGIISSGAVGHRTPEGIHKVLWKKRFHMSTVYPDASGINNMDFSMFFTSRGHALHLGNVNAMSHGCIHVNHREIRGLYNWGGVGIPVIVIRGNYLNLVRHEL